MPKLGRILVLFNNLNIIKIMKNTIRIQVLLAILSAGVMFSSCGSIDIIKRKYRPGFHVDISKKQNKVEVAEATLVLEDQTVVEKNLVETPKAEQIEVEEELVLTAQSTDVEPLSLEQVKRVKMKEVLSSPEFEQLSFRSQMRTIQNKLLNPDAPVSDTHWMAWVSFGTGIGAAFFGLIGLIVAFFGVTLWPLAILLGVAAIVFAILHKKGGYSGEKFRKLGLLFGIIGAGLGVIGMVIWIVWVVGGFGGRYWWR